MITILDNVVSVFLNLINFNGNLNLIVPEKPHWGGNNKVCMYVCMYSSYTRKGLTETEGVVNRETYEAIKGANSFV